MELGLGWIFMDSNCCWCKEGIGALQNQVNFFLLLGQLMTTKTQAGVSLSLVLNFLL